MKDKEKTPLIEAIENHPSIWNEAFLKRIEDLLIHRAPALIEKFIKPGYEFNDSIVRVCCECGRFGPNDVQIPARHLEMLLGLNAWDIETLQELEILDDAVLTTESGPWITLEDVLILLHGHVPQYFDDGEADNDLVFQFELPDGSYAMWEASVSHVNRMIALFSDLYEFGVTKLLNYPEARIPCDKAEYLLGLRRLDLEILAEAGVIPFDVVETDEDDIIDFAVSDLLRFLQDEDWHKTIREIIESAECQD